MTRLADIDPEALAADTTARVAAHARKLASWSESSLAADVAAVAEYAFSGEREGAIDFLVDRIQVATRGSALARPETGEAWWTAEPAPGDSLGLVLLAATARHWIAAGDPVSQAQVAALAGLTRQSVRDLIAAGKLTAGYRPPGKRSLSLITAEEARRFLSARSVLGFANSSCAVTMAGT